MRSVSGKCLVSKYWRLTQRFNEANPFVMNLFVVISEANPFVINDMTSSKCILVIDDEPDIREIVQVSLECTRPWQVLAAKSAAEGMAIAQQNPLDAILLDINMADMDGVGLLKLLKQNIITAHIPILFLTASTQSAAYSLDRKTVLGLGASGVIKKPFDPGTLADQMDTTLQW